LKQFSTLNKSDLKTEIKLKFIFEISNE